MLGLLFGKIVRPYIRPKQCSVALYFPWSSIPMGMAVCVLTDFKSVQHIIPTDFDFVHADDISVIENRWADLYADILVAARASLFVEPDLGHVSVRVPNENDLPNLTTYLG